MLAPHDFWVTLKQPKLDMLGRPHINNSYLLSPVDHEFPTLMAILPNDLGGYRTVLGTSFLFQDYGSERRKFTMHMAAAGPIRRWVCPRKVETSTHCAPPKPPQWQDLQLCCEGSSRCYLQAAWQTAPVYSMPQLMNQRVGQVSTWNQSARRLVQFPGVS